MHHKKCYWRPSKIRTLPSMEKSDSSVISHHWSRAWTVHVESIFIFHSPFHSLVRKQDDSFLWKLWYQPETIQIASLSHYDYSLQLLMKSLSRVFEWDTIIFRNFLLIYHTALRQSRWLAFTHHYCLGFHLTTNQVIVFRNLCNLFWIRCIFFGWDCCLRRISESILPFYYPPEAFDLKVEIGSIDRRYNFNCSNCYKIISSQWPGVDFKLFHY